MDTNATNTNKTPSDYLSDLKSMKEKMGNIVAGDSAKGVAIGTTLGVVIGVGYALIYHKKVFRGAMFGALVGSALSFTYITVKTKK